MSNPWAAWLAEHDTRRFPLSRKQGWDAFATGPPRPGFEALTRAQMSRLGQEELTDYKQARFVWHANPPVVKTQQLSAAFEVIDQVMCENYRDSDRVKGSVVIDAKPGLGKTTIATRYGKKFHLDQYRRYGSVTAEGNQRLPVVFLPLSAGMTLKDLNIKLLQFYGHPAARAKTKATLGSLAVDCVFSCDTRLIVIDDLHFINFRHRNGTEVSNHLKWLANEMPVTFIIVGVGLARKHYFDEGLFGDEAEYAQTGRRATACPVVPFAIDTAAGLRAWTDLLRAFEKHAILADAHPDMLTNHARELFRITQGHIGSLTNHFDRMCSLAITTGAETIDEDIVKRAIADVAAQSRLRPPA
ncbi:ATP-binding protein [Nocardia flavorosea]|uniref:AAA family ATPase n=1 Tax=Nocardia flavorosea TaxID=53429 RepID=A0A846YP95_9NOCA|nr:ATP-binding protein [Nocardia flavorosea]NKY59410.1 AAA family ATPase [Nocardia flavorosea]